MHSAMTTSYDKNILVTLEDRWKCILFKTHRNHPMDQVLPDHHVNLMYFGLPWQGR